MHATIPKGIVGGFEFTSEKFERIGTKGHENAFASANGKQQKQVRQLQSSGTVYRSYPILPFGIVACTFFPSTFLEIAVCKIKLTYVSDILRFQFYPLYVSLFGSHTTIKPCLEGINYITVVEIFLIS